MAKDVVDKTLMQAAQDKLEIKRVRVSERLVHDYQNYLFQEFGDRYTKLLAAYNRQFETKRNQVNVDPQDILRMSTAEMVLYQTVCVKRDRDMVKELYQTQFRSSKHENLVKFMALYDATRENEETLVSNQLAQVSRRVNELNTTIKQMRLGTDEMAVNSEGMVRALAWLTSAQLGAIDSYRPDKYVETLHDDSVEDVTNTISAYGQEAHRVKIDEQKRNLGGN